MDLKSRYTTENTRLRSIFLAIICLFLFSQTSYAEVSWQKFTYFQNWAGLNDQLSSTEIEDNEASEIQNIIFDTGGAIKKRFGYTTLPNNPPAKASTGSTVAITGLTYFRTNAGNKYAVVITNNDGKATAMKKNYNSVGGFSATTVWDNIDYSGLPASYSNNSLPAFTVGENKLIITVPGNVKPFAWAGSGSVLPLTADSDIPNASLCVYHKNHLVVSGNTTNPSRVYFSGLDDITNWIATDFLDVETSDGTQVRGLVSAFDSLYIFKDKSIWRLSGTNRDDFILEKMVSGIGTLSHQSIAVVNNVIYFTTAQNDIAAYDGGYNVVFQSQKIRNTISGLNFSRATNTLGLAFSTYRYNDFDYYCSVSNYLSLTNNRILLFDTAYKAWTKFTGMNVNAWCVAEDANGQNLMLFGDYDGYVHQYPSTNFYDGNVATSPIVAIYQTKWFKYPEVSLGDKYWRLIKTWGLSSTTNTTLDIELKSDYEASGKIVQLNLSEGSALWDSAQWDVDYWSGQSLIIGRHEVEKGTNMFQIRFTNSIVDQGFTIFGWEIFIEPTSRI